MAYENNNYEADSVIKNVFVMKYSPKILRNTIQKRPSSSFLYVVRGLYNYTFEENDIYAESGDIVYLPEGGCYTYEIISHDTQCIQLEFNLEEVTATQTQKTVFAEYPSIIHGHSHELHSLFDDLYDTYYNDKLKSISLIYRLLCICRDSLGMNYKDSDFSKIAPAVQYIEKNFQNKIYVEQLAKLAGISQSHLRRLFKKCLGVSPVKYKNTILMKTACSMLLNESMNVSETAYALRFEDVYTFSQLFKKEIGVSPKKYLEENRHI